MEMSEDSCFVSVVKYLKQALKELPTDSSVKAYMFMLPEYNQDPCRHLVVNVAIESKDTSAVLVLLSSAQSDTVHVAYSTDGTIGSNISGVRCSAWHRLSNTDRQLKAKEILNTAYNRFIKETNHE